MNKTTAATGVSVLVSSLGVFTGAAEKVVFCGPWYATLEARGEPSSRWGSRSVFAEWKASRLCSTSRSIVKI